MSGVPAIVVAAARSGEGKTTVALGMIAALRARGMRVAACKVGPDYLDTGYHALASGAPARNLDPWMCGEAGVREAFARAGRDADIVVVEGVMGMFDGHRDGSPSSTADVAKLLGAPVVLVVDASRASASVGALALGFAAFDPHVALAGVIVNRFREGRDRTAVEASLARAGLPALGWLPAAGGVSLPSRHLGLVPAEEDRERSERALAALGELVEARVDVDALVAEARSRYASVPVGRSDIIADPVTIAVARDEAFAFYYPSNLEALEAAGARLAFFSPLRDAAVPAADGLYLGGGYPELHAESLEANESMRASIHDAVLGGLPTWAECGGMMYLGDSLTDAEGREHVMAGAVPLRFAMHARLQSMGYREGELLGDCPLGAKGMRMRGHEFRYSSAERVGEAACAFEFDGTREGVASATLLASYLHVDLAGAPGAAARFIETCRAGRDARG